MALVACTGGLSACSDFLEVEVKGKVVIPSFLSSPEGLNSAMVGTYNKFITYRDAEFTKYGDVSGNMITLVSTGEGTDMLNQYNFTSDRTNELGAEGNIWTKIYECMANANNIIKYAPSVMEDYPSQSAYCETLRGEAYFVRAICHFDLVQCYAQPYNYTADASHLGVPALTQTPGPDDNPARNTVAQVYDRIIEDLNLAKTCLTGKDEKNFHYVTLSAVHALASRVYLYKGDWKNAFDEAVITIASRKLPKGEEYIQSWNDLNAQGEAILRLSGKDRSSKLKDFYTTVALPADTLLGLFDENDIRLRMLSSGGNAHCSKYDATDGVEVKRNDPVILRLAEQYLNAAEAAFMLADYTNARKYISEILERAVDKTYADAVLGATSDDKLLTLIKTERHKELFGEGHNFFDHRRWNDDIIREWRTNSSLRVLKYPDDRFVLPISQYELNANTSIIPNPGY